MTSKISLPFDHHESISLPTFNVVLRALISNVSRFDINKSSGLISAILDYKWLDVKQVDQSAYVVFIDLYSNFLSVLISSFPKYLHDVMSKLVKEFIKVSPQVVSASASLSLSLSPTKSSNPIINHHDVLAKIIKIIPTSVNTLPGILQKNFPHHLSSSQAELTNYVGNLLCITSYCSELQFTIWQLILECCIKLDVELQNELDYLRDEEIDELINGKEDGNDDDADDADLTLVGDVPKDECGNNSDDDEDDDDAAAENDDEDDLLMGEEYILDTVSSPEHIKSLVGKLDSIIASLLNGTEESFSLNELNSGNGVPLYNTLTSLFKTHILPTHFTKLIQFVHFQISQYQPELSDSFLVMLIDVAFNQMEILEKRLKAMQYLSSYIARARSLSKNQVVFVVSYLVTWLDKYVMERECEILDMESNKNSNMQTTRSTGGMERFKLFYAAFQALLYIFCFRYEMLRLDGNSTGSSKQRAGDSEWESDLDKFFQRAILAKFNPLKFCDESVVFIFAKIATKLNVCYCYSIIEHNKREKILQNNGKSVMPSAVGNFKQKQEFLDLEAYFPFDPLVLPSCKKIVAKNYVEWHNGDDEDDEFSGTTSCGGGLGDDEDDDNEISDSNDEDLSSDEEDEDEDI